MAKNNHERAKQKIEKEISKRIQLITDKAQNCGIGELFYFLHYLHFVRLLPQKEDLKNPNVEVIKTYSYHYTDAYKYLIQLLAKHSQTKLVENDDNSYINGNIVIYLTNLTLEINSHYETLHLISLFEKIDIWGERDRFLKLDFESINSDQILNKYFKYGYRLDRDNDFNKEDLKTKDDFINHFYNEYEPYKDLFKQEFNIHLKEFIELINFILEIISNQIESKKDSFHYIERDLVDINSPKTILNFGTALVIEKEKIYERFGPEIENIIEKLSFDINEFDENQLRYNLITRQPILDYEKHMIVSPEIFLDSLFTNSHYSLLENSDVKEQYKESYANNFLNKIANAAEKFGFMEVTRELELYEGKNQIGDIDLILKNTNDNYLLIEAKNHSLPLDVYFHDYSATKERLEYLKRKWESKVDRRYNHLKKKHLDYDIPSSFTYLIITKDPEILSHFSNYLVLTVLEFEHYLKANREINFEEIYSKIYNLENPRFSREEIKKLQSNLSPGWIFNQASSK